VPVGISVGSFRIAPKIPGRTEIFGRTKISGSPEIFGRTEIFGPPKIPGRTEIFGPPEIPGRIKISGPPEIPGRNRISGRTKISGGKGAILGIFAAGALWESCKSEKFTDEKQKLIKKGVLLALASQSKKGGGNFFCFNDATADEGLSPLFVRLISDKQTRNLLYVKWNADINDYTVMVFEAKTGRKLKEIRFYSNNALELQQNVSIAVTSLIKDGFL
jgi:hypothetical protein